MATKMLRMVVLLVYARSLCIPHLLLQLATPSDVPSVEPRRHTHLKHILALMYITQCANATSTHATRPCDKSAFICYRTEKTSNPDSVADLASSQEEEIPCQMASKAMRASTLTKHL